MRTSWRWNGPGMEEYTVPITRRVAPLPMMIEGKTEEGEGLPYWNGRRCGTRRQNPAPSRWTTAAGEGDCAEGVGKGGGVPKRRGDGAWWNAPGAGGM
jgi:hypothetical protein